MGKYYFVCFLAIVVIVMLVSVSLINTSARSRKEIAISEGQGLRYEDLSNGFYVVIVVINSHDGTVLLRQSLPHGNIDMVVNGVPPTAFRLGERLPILKIDQYI